MVVIFEMGDVKKFSGLSPMSFDEFLSDFRATATMNRWPESGFKFILGAFLEGPALAYFKCIYNESLDFNTICDLLRSEFNRNVDYMEKFYNIRQNSMEDLRTYFFDFTKVAEKAGITDDKIFVRVFLKSLMPDWKLKLGSRLYASRKELQETISQILDIFGESTRIVSANLPIEPPHGSFHRVSFQRPPSDEEQRVVASPRPRSPAPSPSSSAGAPQHAVGDHYYTPRYNLRPRTLYTSNRDYRSHNNVPRSRDTQAANHPNAQGHRR